MTVPNDGLAVPNDVVLVPRATGVGGRAKGTGEPIGAAGLSGVGGSPYEKV